MPVFKKVASGNTEKKEYLEVSYARRRDPRTLSKTNESNLDGVFVKKPSHFYTDP